MKKIRTTIKIGKLFDILGYADSKDEEVRKNIHDIQIRTGIDEFTTISGFVKKTNKQKSLFKFDNGSELKCSNEHLVFGENSYGKICDLEKVKFVDGSLSKKIQTIDIGIGDVFDVSLPDPHVYITPNGMIHHNTTTALALVKELGAKDSMLHLNCSLDTSINDIRNKVQSFATTNSLFGDGMKICIMDECLEENEEVRIGAVNDWKSVKLKDLPKGESFSVPSINMDTGEQENDSAEIISDKTDEVFEVELEDGRIIRATADHPFLVREKGQIVEKLLKDLTETDDLVVV